MKKSHQTQEAELQYEISRLKDQLQRMKDDFAKAQDKKNQVCSTPYTEVIFGIFNNFFLPETLLFSICI